MLVRSLRMSFAAAGGSNAAFFSQSPLDRLHELRSKSDAFDIAIASAATARFLPFSKQKAIVSVAEPATLISLSASELCTRVGVSSVRELAPDLILLGQHVRTKEHWWTLETGDKLTLDAATERAADVRLICRDLLSTPELAAILCHARALSGWHSSHPFCSMCGQKTAIAEVGMKRTCTSCAAGHFPRTDPVVIALVVRGDEVLLGRQKVWPAGRYSCVAGFVDAGENIEQAAAREIHEETGVAVTRVKFFTSQAWPSYSQLMLGCVAEAAPDAVIHLNDQELEHARWFSRAEIAAAAAKADVNFMSAGDGSLTLPGEWAIARTLINAWLAKSDAISF
jgi:NADH pyrophosphatase NudC (nudix superfamily)